MKAAEIRPLLEQRIEGVCAHLLPLGRKVGHEWHVGSLNGEAGSSLKIELNHGKAGIWCDFAGSADDRGDVLDLWQRVRGLTFTEMLKEAAAWLGVTDDSPPSPRINGSKIRPNPAPYPLSLSYEGLFVITPDCPVSQYLTQTRKISLEIAQKLGWQWLDHEDFGPTIAFPVHDPESGTITCFKYRGIADKKYIRATEGGIQHMIGWPNVDFTKEELCIFEGEFDYATAVQLGLNAISVPSGTGSAAKATNLDLEYIQRFKRILIAMDNDPAGDKAATVIANTVGVKLCWRLTLPNGSKDINDAHKDGVASSDVVSACKDALSMDPSYVEPWPEPISFSEIAKAPPPRPPSLIDGIIFVGGTAVISGPSKAHKSYTMMHISLCVASGKPWLGYATFKAPVLYINLELNPYTSSKRLCEISKRMGIEPPTDLLVWNLRGKLVNADALCAKLKAVIEKYKIGLVIIDPHYKISAASGVEENSNDQQGLLLYQLESTCNALGSAVMIAHHFAKGNHSEKNAIDRAAGGGTLARWPDAVMTLTPHDDPDCMTLEVSLRDFAPITPFVVRWDYPAWARDGEMNPEDLKQPGKRGGRPKAYSNEEFLGCLSQGPLTYSEWSHRSGLSRGTFDRALKEAVAVNQVRQVSGTFSRVT